MGRIRHSRKITRIRRKIQKVITSRPGGHEGRKETK